MAYQRVNKSVSSWNPAFHQDHSESRFKPRPFSIQPEPDTEKSQQQQIPAYSRTDRDAISAKLLESMGGNVQTQPKLAIGQSNDELIQAKKTNKQKNQQSQGTVKLRTALDSKVIVTKGEGNRYNIILSLDTANKCLNLTVASYEIISCGSSLKYLPIYVEDVVTDSTALVRIQFNPVLANVKVLVTDEMHGKLRVRVEAIPTPTEQLQAASAPEARDVGPGYVAEGQEKVTEHSGGNELDKVLGSVASAEGGFASTEGSDLGIFTWGQGQWTVGANLLQPVMQFIKDKRPDLFDHYWGEAGLDVRGSVFYYQGKPYTNKEKLRKLFRSSKKQNLHWVNVFAQAGQDPQIQRLQREYQRDEVRDQLEKKISGKSADTWLNTRGKAFYYSMWVNLPGVAGSYFKQACQKAGKATVPTDAIKQAISTKLEDLFRDSSVTARSGDHHHYIAFWGEAGRNQAIEEAALHIANPSLDKTWTKEKWQEHKTNMEKRESRYKKTKADIDKALSGQDVEPDVPAALSSYFDISSNAFLKK